MIIAISLFTLWFYLTYKQYEETDRKRLKILPTDSHERIIDMVNRQKIVRKINAQRRHRANVKACKKNKNRRYY